MPFYYLTLRARKPRNPAYPEDLKTIGDHIRKRRLDLGLYQKDVAAIVNATTSTVTNWEKNRTSPKLYLLPRIIGFLRYNPVTGNPTTLGEKIKQYRIQKGLSLTKLASKLGIDPETLAKYEAGQSNMNAAFKLRMDEMINQR